MDVRTSYGVIFLISVKLETIQILEMLWDLRGDDLGACAWMSRFFPLSLWLFLCCSVHLLSKGRGFILFIRFFLLSFQVALWTVVAHQEVREVSETAQGKRWCCTFQDHSFFVFSLRNETFLCFWVFFLMCFPVVNCNWRIYKDLPLEMLIFFTVADVLKLLMWVCSILNWLCLPVN